MISYAQLKAVGLTPRQVEKLQRDGTLHRIHHGVYAVGHAAETPLAAETAALLALGEHAALSHLTALRLHGLLRLDPRAAIDVTIRATGSAHRRPQINVHRSRTLTRKQVRFVQGLPMPRTQVEMFGFRVDAFWREANFAVEIDSFQWHSTKPAFERDRLKQRVLQDRGIEVSRVTSAQMRDDSLQVVAHLSRQLTMRRPPDASL